MKRNFLFCTAALFLAFGLLSCDDNGDGGIIQTPLAADFIIGNLTQTAGSVTPVTIIPRAGKSTGAITIFYEGTMGTTFERSQTLPTTTGTYTVTFDIAASSGWNAASGLFAGTLIINERFLPELEPIELVTLLNFLQALGMFDVEIAPGVVIPGAARPVIDGQIAAGQLTLNDMFGIFQDGATYEVLSFELDFAFYMDEEGNEEFVGTFVLEPDTVFFSNIPFDLIDLMFLQGAGRRQNFAVVDLVNAYNAKFGETRTFTSGTLDELVDALQPGRRFSDLDDVGVRLFESNAALSRLGGGFEIPDNSFVLWSIWTLEEILSMFPLDD